MSVTCISHAPRTTRVTQGLLDASAAICQAPLMFTIPSNSDMSFPSLTCKVLEEYSIRPPKNENFWLGPWLTILSCQHTNQDIFRAGCQRSSRSYSRGRETCRPAFWPSHNSHCRNKKIRTTGRMEWTTSCVESISILGMSSQKQLSTRCIGSPLLVLIGNMVSGKKMNVGQGRLLTGIIQFTTRLPLPLCRLLPRLSVLYRRVTPQLLTVSQFHFVYRSDCKAAGRFPVLQLLCVRFPSIPLLARGLGGR